MKKYKVTTTCTVTSEYIVLANNEEHAKEIYNEFPEHEVEWKNETVEKVVELE